MIRALRKSVKWALLRCVLPVVDSAILWCFGWQKERVLPGVQHYRDPRTGDLLLRDVAVSICEQRARSARNAIR